MASPARVCWRMSWSGSFATTFRCTVRRRFTPATASISIVPRWADWVGQCAWLLRPLVDAIGAHVMAAARVYADAAAIYTLTETAKLNRFDPEDYLRKVLERIADHPVRRVHEFLPWNLDGIRQRLDQRDAA